MLSARVVPVLIFLFFSLGNLMPGKHLLIETESGDGDGEGSEPDGEGTVNTFYGGEHGESRFRLAFTFVIEIIISGRCEDDKPWVRVLG